MWPAVPTTTVIDRPGWPGSRSRARHRPPARPGAGRGRRDRVRGGTKVDNRGGELPQEGDLARGAPAAVEGERRRNCREDRLVRSHGTCKWVAPELRDQVGPTDHEPSLGPADELVAGERHDVGARGETLLRGRLVGEPEALRGEQRAAAEVVDDDRTALIGEPRQLGGVRALDEPGLDEVRRMDAED